MSTPIIEPSTTGIAARDFQWALRSVVGDDVFEDILRSIPREARDAVRSAPTAAWVPLVHIGEVIDQACQRTGLDEDALLTRTTRIGSILRPTNPEMKRAPPPRQGPCRF